jgi:hypothetical protein
MDKQARNRHPGNLLSIGLLRCRYVHTGFHEQDDARAAGSAGAPIANVFREMIGPNLISFAVEARRSNRTPESVGDVLGQDRGFVRDRRVKSDGFLVWC